MSAECPYGGGDHRELIRQAQQQGREDNADHGMCYVHGSKALDALIRQAKAEERELWVSELEAMRQGLTWERATRPASQQTTEWADVLVGRIIDKLAALRAEAP